MDHFTMKINDLKSKISLINMSAEFASSFVSTGEISAAAAHMRIVKRECATLAQSVLALERLHQADHRRMSSELTTQNKHNTPDPVMQVSQIVGQSIEADHWEKLDEKLLQSMALDVDGTALETGSVKSTEVGLWLYVFCLTNMKLKILHVPGYETKQTPSNIYLCYRIVYKPLSLFAAISISLYIPTRASPNPNGLKLKVTIGRKNVGVVNQRDCGPLMLS
jgi:hypothetical protein